MEIMTPEQYPPEIRGMLELATRWGVTIYILPPEVDYSRECQAAMEVDYGASRSPVGEEECGFKSYASFGDPATGKRGSLYIPLEGYRESSEFLPATIILHEIAHCVVGEECWTVPWEDTIATLLGPEMAEDMRRYSVGATDEIFDEKATNLYQEWGVVPSLLL